MTVEELGVIFDRIEKRTVEVDYDHRPFQTYHEPHEHIRLRDATEDYRVRYACFKYAVAEVLQPKSIVEIGVRGGVSALAFLHAVPTAVYFGIDSDLDGKLDGVNYVAETMKWLYKLGYNFGIDYTDSQTLPKIPRADLVHIDGCHSKECTAHDVKLAFQSGADWILVDDSNEESVKFGILESVIGTRCTMRNYPHTIGGNVLINTKEQR